MKNIKYCIQQVILLGDSGVGKTCLLVRFHNGKFLSGNYITTVGIDFRVRNIRDLKHNTYYYLDNILLTIVFNEVNGGDFVVYYYCCCCCCYCCCSYLSHFIMSWFWWESPWVCMKFGHFSAYNLFIESFIKFFGGWKNLNFESVQAAGGFQITMKHHSESSKVP